MRAKGRRRDAPEGRDRPFGVRKITEGGNAKRRRGREREKKT